MSSEPDASQQLRRRVLSATAIAAALLFIFIAPAEFGWDPTGVGRVLGLTSIGEAKQIAAQLDGGSVMHAHPRPPRKARVAIRIEGRAEVEYKAWLEQGEPLLYSWSVAGGPLYAEFHGDPTVGTFPHGYFQRYELIESTVARSGSFVAPFTGRHGWYWRNLSDEPAVVTLEVSGYYDKLGRIEANAAALE